MFAIKKGRLMPDCYDYNIIFINEFLLLSKRRFTYNLENSLKNYIWRIGTVQVAAVYCYGDGDRR